MHSHKRKAKQRETNSKALGSMLAKILGSAFFHMVSSETFANNYLDSSLIRSV